MGNRAALFLREEAGPSARLTGITRLGACLVLEGAWMNVGDTVRFRDLRVRQIPKDTRLDAPAKLPKGAGAATTEPDAGSDHS